jgi:hypothetical protein
MTFTEQSTNDQPSTAAALVRQLLTFAGGFAVAHGVGDAQTLTQLIGGVVAAGSASWSLYSAQKAKQAVAKSQGTPTRNL